MSNSLEAREEKARTALKTIVEERESKLKELKEIIEKYTKINSQLRRSERTLSIKANQRIKSMRATESQIKSIQDYLTRCKEMHSKMLGGITAPSWAVAHHYHMTSIEHTMGHTQPHVLEVGDMIRGHIHLYAMANCTTQYRKQAEIHLRKANSDCSKAADKVKSVYAKLRGVRSNIIKSLKVLNLATKTVGTNRLDLTKSDPKPKKKPPPPGPVRGPRGSRKNYLALKMRYLSSLNIDQNVEVTSSMAQTEEGENDDGTIIELTPEQEEAFQTDLQRLSKLLAGYTKLSLGKQRIMAELDKILKSREKGGAGIS